MFLIARHTPVIFRLSLQLTVLTVCLWLATPSRAQLPSVLSDELLTPLADPILTDGSIDPADYPIVLDSRIPKPTKPKGKHTRRKFLKGKPVTPDESRLLLDSEPQPDVMSLTGIDGTAQTTTALEGEPTPSSWAGKLADLPALSAAMGGDIDRIYRYVHDTIRYLPSFGLTKSAEATVLDKSGNAFDQANLMAALLRAAGHDAKVSIGAARFTSDELAQWMGIDTKPFNVIRFLGYAGIPHGAFGTNEAITSVIMTHAWVTVTTAEGAVLSFDPAFKSHETKVGIDLDAAMGFSSANFLAKAKVGATQGDDWVQGITPGNVDGALTGYTTNLINELRANHPTADIVDVIGGRKIVPASAQTPHVATLPYVESIEGSWVAVPNKYRTWVYVELTYQNTGFYRYLWADELYGRRATISFNEAGQAYFKVDGVTIFGGTTFPSRAEGYLFVYTNRPFAANYGTYGDGGAGNYIREGGTYLIVNGWGGEGRDLVELHRDRLAQARKSGLPPEGEEVKGEALAVMAHSYLAQSSGTNRLFSNLTNVELFEHHTIGVIGYGYAGPTPFFDLFMSFSSAVNRSGEQVDEYGVQLANGAIGSAFEHGVLEQFQDVNAVSTTRLFDLSSGKGDKMFYIYYSNWSDVHPQLVNYSIPEKNTLFYYLAAGYILLVPQDGDLTIDNWTGIAFAAIDPNSGSLSSMISAEGYQNNGGSSTGQVSPDELATNSEKGGEKDNPKTCPVPPKAADPILLRTCSFVDGSTDLTTGSGAWPFGLRFSRGYASANAKDDGPLGRGWSHNLGASLDFDSDGLQGMGEDSAIDAASAITAIHASIRLLSDSRQFDRMLIAVLASKWLMDSQTDNVIALRNGGKRSSFVRLADGSYNPTDGSADRLTTNSDGSVSWRGKAGSELDFDAAGRLSQWRDTNGNDVDFTYGFDGQLSAVTAQSGRQLDLSYTNGRIASLSDGLGRSVSYAYDADGNLISATDPMGGVTSYAYDSQGRMTQLFTPAFPTTAKMTNTYDAMGKVTTQTTPEGGLFTLFANGRESLVEKPDGGVELHRFDEYGNHLSATGRASGPVSHTYDGLNRRVSTTQDVLDLRTEFAYDGQSNLVGITRHARAGFSDAPIVEHFVYEPALNRMVERTDALGRVTTYAYDAAGNLMQITEPAVAGVSPIWSFAYNARGQVVRRTDPTGKAVVYAYDTQTGNRLSSTIDPNGLALTTSFGYNARGDVTSVTDPRGNTTTYAFDDLRNLISITGPAGSGALTALDRDANGNIIAIRQATGDALMPWRAVTSTFGPRGERLTITDDDGDVARFTYDGEYRPTSATDGAGRVNGFAYDGAGRLVSQTDSNDGSSVDRSYAIDGADAGVLTRMENQPGLQGTGLSYDGFMRFTHETFASQTTAPARTYDAAGNMISKLGWDGVTTIAYDYDAHNRPVTKRVGGAVEATFAYDAAGRTIAVNQGAGDIVYARDRAGRVLSITHPNGKVIGYEYDAAGNRTRIAWPDGYFITYEFDALNRMTVVRENGTQILASYGYDALGQRTRLDFGNGASTSYTFEADGDLARVAHAFGGTLATFDYTYDGAGKRISATVSDGWQLPSPSTETNLYGINLAEPRYDTVDGEPQDFDGGANLVADGANAYIFDVQNRLVSATSPTTTSIAYAYDAFGRRVGKTVDGVVTTYLYSGDDVIAEYDGAGDLLRRFVFGPRIDEPIAMVLANGDRFYHHADALGSIIALSNDSGTMTESYGYLPFGEVRADGATPYRFTGRRYDPETGVYYYRNRYYDPWQGRFISRDPLGVTEDINLYRYVGNDPVNFIDPYGLGIEGAKKGAAIGAVLGTITGATAGGASGAACGPGVMVCTPVGAAEGAVIGGGVGAAIGAVIGSAVEDLGKCISDILFSEKKGSPEGKTGNDAPRSNPVKGEPGSVSSIPDKDGKPKQDRHYGNDGYPDRDIDYDHDHGQGKPHVHDWGRPNDGSPPTHKDRKPGYPLSP